MIDRFETRRSHNVALQTSKLAPWLHTNGCRRSSICQRPDSTACLPMHVISECCEGSVRWRPHTMTRYVTWRTLNQAVRHLQAQILPRLRVQAVLWQDMRHWHGTFCTRERLPKRNLLGFFLLSDFQWTKALSFHYRSSLNFAHRLMAIFSAIAPGRIFNLSRNKLIIMFNHQIARTQQCRQQRGHTTVPHVSHRCVATSDDTWWIEEKCAFPCPTATRCCSCYG